MLPLIAGILFGNLPIGLIVSSGAYNVSFSDGVEPYAHRGRRMWRASVLVGLAVFAGGISDVSNTWAVVIAVAWAFGAGMLVSLGTEAADLGTISLVTLVVYAAQSMSPKTAALSGLLAFGGGLLQTGLSLFFWPLHRYRPEQRELAQLYGALSQIASVSSHFSGGPPGTADVTKTRLVLAPLMLNHNVEAERFRSLLSQAERIRLALITLARLHERMEHEAALKTEIGQLEQFLEAAARVLKEIEQELSPARTTAFSKGSLGELEKLLAQFRLSTAYRKQESFANWARDLAFHVEALGGQLRAASELAGNTTPAGNAAFAQREARKNWYLRLEGPLATMRANLTFGSTAYRHAVRLAASIAIGDGFGRAFLLQRSYWIPMTIAIVLKPDFTSTFSRGVLRLIGTFFGLLFSTALLSVLPHSPVLSVVLIGIFTFCLRSVGAANYGIFVAMVSAIVVLLIGLTGVAPAEVIKPRGMNTLAGGALALLAYWVWPTWERTQIGETIAQMLDAYRAYFRGVMKVCLNPENWEADSMELDQLRQASRLSRSNLEASAIRLGVEPRNDGERISLLNSMLASSHRLVYAIMAIESGGPNRQPPEGERVLQTLSHEVELTLYLLSARLRGSPLEVEHLPNLRQRNEQFLLTSEGYGNRDTLLNTETDRLVNSLNTLTGQIFRWTSP